MKNMAKSQIHVEADNQICGVNQARAGTVALKRTSRKLPLMDSFYLPP
jgi:hypothetical protein